MSHGTSYVIVVTTPEGRTAYVAKNGREVTLGLEPRKEWQTRRGAEAGLKARAAWVKNGFRLTIQMCIR